MMSLLLYLVEQQDVCERCALIIMLCNPGLLCVLERLQPRTCKE